ELSPRADEESPAEDYARHQQAGPRVDPVATGGGVEQRAREGPGDQEPDDDGQITATSPDRGVEGGGEVRAGGREDHERDRPDADPDGGWVGAPPVQRDKRRDPDQDVQDAQPGRVHVPSARQGGGADRKRAEVDR